MPKGLQGTPRITIVSFFVVMIISSPVIVISDPVLAYPAGIDTSSSHATLPMSEGYPPSISSLATPTTQAALTGVSARQTNNIVGTQSYYDVVFTTSTTGTIKFIDITFPAGILIGAAPQLAEREGIGAGTAAKTSNTEIRYTVTSAVSVPAGTQIRLELFNIVNPTVPSTTYKVTVTTRNAGGTTIDGPTPSNSLNMKQIGPGQIAPGAVPLDFTPVFTNPSPVGPQQFLTLDAFCPAGEIAVSGGYDNIPNAGMPFMHAVTDRNLLGNGWRIIMYNEHPTDIFSFRAHANCMPSSLP